MVSQSTNSCSDKDTSSPFVTKLLPSTFATVANDQQLPHWAWFLTSFTPPFSRQSKFPDVLIPRNCTAWVDFSAFSLCSFRILGVTGKLLRALYSASLRSAMGLKCP